ncbi:MAG: hypothetical protein R2694_09680 [Ilumatobacteraceae bacterium]
MSSWWLWAWPLNSYTCAGEFTMNVCDTVEFAGHSFTLQTLEDFQTDRSVGIRAEIAIDGGQAYAA